MFACVYGILFVVFSSARQKRTENKFGSKRKEEAGGWKTFVIFAYIGA